MKTVLVSYATESFLESQRRLTDSAIRHGIGEVRAWDRAALERTVLYESHREVLAMTRGAGYWLWKPFIVAETLKELDVGDVVVYSDAGIEIVGGLLPLLRLCLDEGGLLLFAGHYEDLGAPGPNLCAKWTKRDCFVGMGCDDPRYHRGQMLDASFLVVAKTERVSAFLHEWLSYCGQTPLLTDEPNRCGLPDLPGFVEHRHDQSILSLLAIRDGLQLFRHPSQMGNHLKDERYRQAGEWLRYPYARDGLYRNSPYGTLLNHHRRESLALVIRRVIPAPRNDVFSMWTEPEKLKRWWGAFGLAADTAEVDLRAGGRYRLDLSEAATEHTLCISGEYSEVLPPETLAYSWCWTTSRQSRLATAESRVRVEFRDMTASSTEIRIVHEAFPNDAVRERHHVCWTTCLDRLTQALGAGSSDSGPEPCATPPGVGS